MLTTKNTPTARTRQTSVNTNINIKDHMQFPSLKTKASPLVNVWKHRSEHADLVNTINKATNPKQTGQIKDLQLECKRTQKQNWELIEFLGRNKIDIMLINETKYTSKDKIKFKGYTCYRKERENSAGGVAILVKDSIPHKILKISDNITLEAVGITLLSRINVITAYRRPSSVLRNRDLDELINSGDKVLIIGDLNAVHLNWNCNRNNRSGNILENYVQNNNCTIMYPDEPTNYPPNNTTPTTIDIAINKNVSNVSNLEVRHELSSDHNPVLLNLGVQHKIRRTKIVYIYEKANWKEFRKILNEKVEITPRILTTDDIDKEVQKLIYNINYSIKQTIPTKDNSKISNKLAPNLIYLIKERNKLRKLWQRTKVPQIKATVNQMNRFIKKSIIEYRNNMWEKQLKKLSPNDNSLWRMTKIFKSEYLPMPTLHKNGTEAMADQAKADTLATQFEEVHNIELVNNTTEQTSIIEITRNYLENLSITEAHKYYTNPKGIFDEINKMPSRKAPRMDNIQNIILNNLTKKAVVQIMYIINTSIRLGYFSTHWKTGLVTPILKPEKKSNDPASYRPISLLCTLMSVENRKSSKRKVRAGVPQRSVLGPKLFNIFINDIPKFSKTNTALFADDLAIYAHSFYAIVAAKQLQIHINILEKFYQAWKITVNKGKTEVIVFARKVNDRKIIQPITVYGHPSAYC
ncbi:hypothetical protein KPH14_006424 [Odynerus spinipes]|uniref:Reverse transcriptase domain-containing protein n=1 Tax=Odynerus spinipes TaxID=1348599 RepID=A0AAD9RQV5_9HYME|nr:hypothetical protein KPH14_006424 [Odynerus spinipes]